MSSPIQCKCGLVAEKKTSQTQKNPDRDFYACGQQDYSMSCGFFKWADSVGKVQNKKQPHVSLGSQVDVLKGQISDLSARVAHLEKLLMSDIKSSKKRPRDEEKDPSRYDYSAEQSYDEPGFSFVSHGK